MNHSEEQLMGIIGSATDAIITVDDEQAVTLFDAAAGRMFRCPACEAAGRPLDRFIPLRFRDVPLRHSQEREVGMTSRWLDILMVEDNPADVRLTREALQDGNGQTALNVVKDGVEAMAFLRRQGRYADAVRPDLIVLDLNLPRKDGREVLSEIKSDPDLRRIPVVILTTSRAERDIVTSYDLHANCYIAKPVDLDEFLGLIRSIEQFWLTAVILSPR